MLLQGELTLSLSKNYIQQCPFATAYPFPPGQNPLPLELLKVTAIFIGLWRVNATLPPRQIHFCSAEFCLLLPRHLQRFLMASSPYINTESFFQLFKRRPCYLSVWRPATPFPSSPERLLFIYCINYYWNTRRKHFRDFKLLLIASATIAVLRESLLLSLKKRAASERITEKVIGRHFIVQGDKDIFAPLDQRTMLQTNGFNFLRMDKYCAFYLRSIFSNTCWLTFCLIPVMHE